MTVHDHGIKPGDDAVIRHNWEATQTITDALLDSFRESRGESCAPWCIPAYLEEMMLSLSQFELIALLHATLLRIVDGEDLDRGLDAPTPP